MENLFDLCCDYIENSHTAQGVMIANEKIYNYCADYINGYSPKYLEDTLRDYFKKYLS